MLRTPTACFSVLVILAFLAGPAFASMMYWLDYYRRFNQSIELQIVAVTSAFALLGLAWSLAFTVPFLWLDSTIKRFGTAFGVIGLCWVIACVSLEFSSAWPQRYWIESAFYALIAMLSGASVVLLVRWAFGWQLVDRHAALDRRKALSMQELFVVIILAALFLAFAKLAAPYDDFLNRDVNQSILTIICMVGLGLVAVVPGLTVIRGWLTPPTMTRLSVRIWAYFGLPILIAASWIIPLIDSPSGVGGLLLYCPMVAVCTMLVLVPAGLWYVVLLRRAGFRLVTAKDFAHGTTLKSHGAEDATAESEESFDPLA